MREAFFTAKDSQMFLTKNIGIFEILTFEILKKTITINVVSFEQPGPDFYFRVAINFQDNNIDKKMSTGIYMCLRKFNLSIYSNMAPCNKRPCP